MEKSIYVIGIVRLVDDWQNFWKTQMIGKYHAWKEGWRMIQVNLVHG